MEPDVPDAFESSEFTQSDTDEDGMEAGTDKTDDESSGVDASDEDDAAGSIGTTDKSPSTAQASISALEYNKVIRLLQNREFPVDRAEIETVAANAYELSRADCAAVIDLAVDQELLDEEGGKLYRPE